MSSRIAFIGTGIMGAPMAGHLLAAGNQVTVHNRTRAKAQPLIGQGARWADSPRAAAEAADFIFLNVPDTPDVEAVIAAILPTARSGQIVVDHSTISPSATRRLAEQVKEKGGSMLDAPVSGGDVGARNATLSIMVGGDAAAFERAGPLLEKLGKTIVHCGPSGAGQLTKLVNQILVSGTLMAVCEALTFAAKNGLDLGKTVSVVSGGAAASWQLSNLGPKIVARDFAPGFMIDLMQKDLRLVQQAAGEANAPLLAAALVHQLYSAAQAAGSGREGTQALAKVIEGLAKM